jgi:DNA-binding beta-propeller fold protein YncE
MKSFFAFIIYSAIFFPLCGNICAQDYFFSDQMGKFKNASSFTYSSAGFIYVTDSGTDEVYKLDTLGNLLKSAGGYGWDPGLFDVPTGIYANPLSVYVCDKNNHRVQRFDKDLNYFWLLTTRNSDTTDERFGYPLGCTVSQQGDLYILDSENKRIVKFDLFGNFALNFGGYDAGAFSLTDPQSIAISNSNNLFVIDGKQIVAFDQYGSGSGLIKSDDELKSINITFNMLTANSDSAVYFCNLNFQDHVLSKLKLDGIDRTSEITGSFIFNNKLYLLTKETILVFIKS